MTASFGGGLVHAYLEIDLFDGDPVLVIGDFPPDRPIYDEITRDRVSPSRSFLVVGREADNASADPLLLLNSGATFGELAAVLGDDQGALPVPLRLTANDGVGGDEALAILEIGRAVFEVAGAGALMAEGVDWLRGRIDRNVRTWVASWASTGDLSMELIDWIRQERTQDVQVLARRLRISVVDAAKLLRGCGFKHISGSHVLWVRKNRWDRPGPN